MNKMSFWEFVSEYGDLDADLLSPQDRADWLKLYNAPVKRAAAAPRPMKKADREVALADLLKIKTIITGIVSQKYGAFLGIQGMIDALAAEIDAIKPTKLTKERYYELKEANAEIGRTTNKARADGLVK